MRDISSIKKFLILLGIFIGLVALNSLSQKESAPEEKTDFSAASSEYLKQSADIPDGGNDSNFKAPEETSWKNYMDEKSGFKITFPDSWKDFRIQESVMSGKGEDAKSKTDFGGWEPNANYLFSLFEEPKETYREALKANDEGGFSLTYVGQANKAEKVILCFGVCCKGGSGTDKYSSFEMNRCAEVPDILKTFETL